MPIWTEEDDKRLIELIEGGLSASAIAERLPGDRTRNAVIGRMSRLKISSSTVSSSRFNNAAIRWNRRDVIVDLGKKFPEASIFEISEAVAIELSTVLRAFNDCKGRRSLGGESDFESADVRQRVAAMRADLQQSA
jgi:hypothetical protein